MVSIVFKCILLVYVSLQVCQAANWTDLPDDDPFILGEATVFLVHKFLINTTTTLVIAERNIRPQSNNQSSDLLEYILQNIQSKISVQLYFGQSEDQPWEYHIFLVDGAEAFKQIRWSFPMTFYERNFRFLIILTNFMKRYLLILRQIFEYCNEYHVLNAHVILKHPQNGVVIYGYKLFSPKMCRVVQPVLHFVFNKGLSNLKQIFPEKLTNLYGCPVNIVARENPPLLTFRGNPSNPKPVGLWDNLIGIDAALIKIISFHMNFTIRVRPFPVDRPLERQSSTSGCFSELLNGRADIAIGGFSASDLRRNLLSATHSYHQSPVMFAVCGGQEYTSITRLAKPFNVYVWIVLIVLLIVGVMVIGIVRFQVPFIQQFVFGPRNNTPMTNFFAVFLGYPVTQLPQRNFARYLLLVWLLATLIIRNAYQGSMYDSIRMRRFVKTPSGFDELMRWEYNILLPAHHGVMGLIQQNRTIISSDNPLIRLMLVSEMKGKFATVVLRDNFIKFMENYSQHGHEMQLIQEPFYVHQSVMYFNKESAFVGGVNQNLKKFAYAGVVGYVIRDSMKNPDLLRVDRATNANRPISINLLSGSFKIYAAFLGVALIIFILELMSKSSGRLRILIERIN